MLSLNNFKHLCFRITKNEMALVELINDQSKYSWPKWEKIETGGTYFPPVGGILLFKKKLSGRYIQIGIIRNNTYSYHWQFMPVIGVGVILGHKGKKCALF